jgi:predicted glycoside hydrolase/deacetylase ChbG (UPF0249 family)
VSAGILEAHAAGTVAATSMMVHCPGWDDGVRQVRATPTLDVGLHFNMLIGRPLTAARSLRRASGEFHSLRGLAIRALAGAIRAAEVERECEAQLDALGEAGIRVTHIDSHRHTHVLPVIHGAVARVAVARGLVLRRPVESARWFPADVASLAHRALVAGASRLSAVDAPRPRAADHFVGISLQGRAAFAARLARVIAMLPAGTTELMVHPGHADDTLATVDGYTHERERELAALTAPGLHARLGGDAALIGFDAV